MERIYIILVRHQEKLVKPKIGILLPSREVVLGLMAPNEVLELAQQVERLGYESAWIGDSLLAKPRLDPLTTLSAIAALTSKITLGTAVLLAALRNPFLLAQQWATLDRISSGRTIMGVGIGGGRYTRELFEKEFAVTGIKYSQRMRVLEEMIKLVRQLWTQDRVNYKGQFLESEDVSLNPKPSNSSCPIWLSASVAETALRRVAQLADGWIANIVTPEEFAESWRKIQNYTKESGSITPNLHPTFYMYLNIDDDEQKALASSDLFLEKYYNTRFSSETLQRWGPFGSANRIADRMDKTISAGAEGFILHFASLEPRKQLERFTKEVLPSF